MLLQQRVHLVLHYLDAAHRAASPWLASHCTVLALYSRSAWCLDALSHPRCCDQLGANARLYLQASDALKPAADTVAEQAMPTAKKFTDGQLKPAADKLAKNAVPTAKQVGWLMACCAELWLPPCAPV